MAVSIWDYIVHAVKSCNFQSLKKVARNIEKLNHVQTPDGKGKAWIREIANENLFVDAFKALGNTKDIEK